MALAAFRFCGRHGCHMVVRGRFCQSHQPRAVDRPLADVRKLYHTARWRRLRARKFADDPRCVACLAEGRAEPWTDLDHVRPHRGDLVLFWDDGNLQGLCAAHHRAKTGGGG